MIEKGSIVTLRYEGRDFQVVVIDPNGLGEGQPSVGFGLRMMEKNTGVPESTLRSWIVNSLDGVRESEDLALLQLPSGKGFRVRDILGSDGNDYRVIEASDWFALAIDLLINPGRTGKGVRAKLGEFLNWFAVKGFYAEAYVALKGVYTEKDSRATTKWLESRQLGKVSRKLYTDLLQSQGCQDYEYASWTDYVYQGLFGMTAREMKIIWDRVEGDASIARNYIPKPEALDAVSHCEDMTVRFFVDDLQEAHDQAIKLTKRKFLGGV
jgi:hypothetical protein